MTHFQISFTRISGKGSGDGWQTLNASHELPHDSVTAFARFQNGNITPPTFDSEDINSQIVTELQNDGSFTFYTRIKCNAAADDRGRPIMFAHSYAFTINEFIQSPQLVLSLDQSNYAFEATETETLPPSLSRMPEISLKDAVESLGLSVDQYVILVQCIYFILDSKVKNSLHIICDCHPDTIRKLMVCILAALPFEFRKKITYSTYEFQSGVVKTIIFDRKMKSAGSYYINPQTGENNVISNVILKRWEKFEFMKFVPENYLSNSNLDEYFKKIEDKLMLFGSSQTTSLDLYKIANDLILDEQNRLSLFSPDALSNRLNELLSAPISHPYLDQQIQYVLADILESNVNLNDVLSEKLCKKLETTTDQNLIECGYLYNSKIISQMTIEDGGKYLYDSFSNRQSEPYIKIINQLKKDKKCNDILNYLYFKMIPDNLPSDKEHIINYYEETKTIDDRKKVEEILRNKALAYLKSVAIKQKNPLKLMQEVDELLQAVFHDTPEIISQIKNEIIHEFWLDFQYIELHVDTPEIYDEMILPRDNKCIIVKKFFLACHLFNTRNFEFKYVTKELFSGKYAPLSGEDRRVLIEKMQSYCLDNRQNYADTELDIWLTVASFNLDDMRNAAKFLIENHLPTISDNFEESYTRSTLMSVTEIKAGFINSLTVYSQEKNVDSIVASDALRVIKDHDKRLVQEIKQNKRVIQYEFRGEGDRKQSFIMSIIHKLFSRK